MKAFAAAFVLLLAAVPGAAQIVVTSIEAEPRAPRSNVAFSYGDVLKFSVDTATRAQADELRLVQVRLFSGSLQEKLNTGANTRGVRCHYYDTILLRPTVTRRSATNTLLQFPISLGPGWASEGGRPRTQRYTIVFEKVTTHSLARGTAKSDKFGIGPAAHNRYFSSAIEMVVDPGRLTASMIRAAGSAAALQQPEDCAESRIDARRIEVADIRPAAVRPRRRGDGVQPERVTAP